MSDIVETRIKKIGNSLWALIPRDTVRSKKLKEGQKIRISIIAPDRQKAIEEAFGMFKGAKPFKREDHGDREF